MSEDLAATEAFAGDIPSLESLPIESLVSLLLGLQQRAVTAAAAASEQVRAAVTPIAERMANGARWHTIGAGSSGRIAALDAVELYPTFGLEPSRICIHLAGGDAAFL
ncbi:MAG TPA: N-acetylmuramic acid 6-phosphate etherase, partial [Candidatus Dormibacteraeota bacterium]|nr:N-acetylmuramic acid 6-phosphate etherase [Candidatus Dormibacteraeota bacterium]